MVMWYFSVDLSFQTVVTLRWCVISVLMYCFRQLWCHLWCVISVLMYYFRQLWCHGDVLFQCWFIISDNPLEESWPEDTVKQTYRDYAIQKFSKLKKLDGTNTLLTIYFDIASWKKKKPTVEKFLKFVFIHIQKEECLEIIKQDKSELHYLFIHTASIKRVEYEIVFTWFCISTSCICSCQAHMKQKLRAVEALKKCITVVKQYT